MPILALIALAAVAAIAMSGKKSTGAAPAALVTDPTAVANAKSVLSQLKITTYVPSPSPPNGDPTQSDFVAALAGYQQAMNLHGVALRIDGALDQATLTALQNSLGAQ